MSRTTAYANILSSLGIKGATESGGKKFYGYVPTIGSDGTLDISLIPTDDLERTLSVPPLSEVCFVDPKTSSLSGDGSIAQPYATLGEAAGSGADTIVLASGEYSETSVAFSQPDSSSGPFRSSVTIIALGECTFTASMVSFSGLRGSGCSITFQDITFNNGVRVPRNTTVTLLGKTRITRLEESSANSDDAAEEPSLSLVLSPESFVSVSRPASISYLAASSRIANTSTVEGSTEEDALNRLNARKIRAARFKIDGGVVALDELQDIGAEASDEYDLYDLSALERSLVNIANSVYYKSGDNIVVGDIAASGDIMSVKSIAAPEVVATESLLLSDVPLAVDENGYLIVKNDA